MTKPSGPATAIPLFDIGFDPANKEFPFSRQLPVFNWFYPFSERAGIQEPMRFLAGYDWSSLGRISAYFHIPFCDTICTFCPFTRGMYKEEEEVEYYVQALIRELQLKKTLTGKLKVDSVFIGGGTPSVLSPDQIRRLGESIHLYLDTSGVTEFAVEVEVKSVSREKLLAFKEIGVNRISFGVQTFLPAHRKALNLFGDISAIDRVAAWNNELFPYTNIDMIYGQAGQTSADVLADARQAISLGTTSVDFYPLNNVAAQVKMHKAFEREGMARLDARERISQRKDIAAYMLSQGYSRINGYSFAKTGGENNTLIQAKPKFLYHDILYGFNKDAVVGFGASAHSQIPGSNVYNEGKRKDYMSSLNQYGKLPVLIKKVATQIHKGIVTFPYRGSILKAEIEAEQPTKEVLRRIRELTEAGLLSEEPDRISLTETGWLYYVNIMYYLMPEHGQQWISKRIDVRIMEKRFSEETALY